MTIPTSIETGGPLVVGTQAMYGAAPKRRVRFATGCEADGCFIRVNGEIDISNSLELDAEIDDVSWECKGIVIVSFAECGYADCSCLRILLRQFTLLASRLYIVAPPGSRLRRILDVTGLVASLPIYGSATEAYVAASSA